jgi:hypothetical protein
MKLWAIVFAVAGIYGLGCGLVGGLVNARTGPAKVINWTPADRYQMQVDSWGRVWRLDKATGTIHIVSGNLSFDVPEYRNE